MSKCYRYEKRNYDDPIFNNVDATYIIHLENNGRITDIEDQLSKYHPSRDVFIVFNKGYKKCNKNPSIKNSALDLIDANQNIILHSIENGYDTILILEDDFQFSPQVNNIKDQTRVDKFLENNKDNDYLYYLGALPYIKTYGFISYHPNIILSMGTHACIFSKSIKKKILDNIDNETDWDHVMAKLSLYRYGYYKPLCYQLIPETENQKTWFNTTPILRYCVINFFKTLKLDTQTEPGYGFFYVFSEVTFTLILLLIILICYMVYKKIKKSL